LVWLSELSSCFKANRRENSRLSEVLREAWDGKTLLIPNRKGNDLYTSDYAISVIGDIIPDTLKSLMAKGGTESFDGFANRFLWCQIYSPRDLANGGDVKVLSPYLTRLKDALTKAKTIEEFRRSQEAEALWKGVYGSLKRSGDTVPHTDRGCPNVLRLSMVYAIVDGSKVIEK
jgi:hypothetical protein